MINDLQQKDSVLERIVACKHKMYDLREPLLNNTKQFAYRQLSDSGPVRKLSAEKTQEKISRLQHIVKFRASDKLGFGGETLAIEHLKDVVPLHAQEFPSIISYSRRQYDLLIQHAKSGQDPAYLLVLQWEFATTLCHECTHALTYAQNWLDAGGKYNEIYFDWNPTKAPVAEAGFEFEVRQSGGHLTRLYKHEPRSKADSIQRYQYSDGSLSELQGVMVMWEWPYRGLVAHYEKGKYPMDCRKRAAFRPFDVAWRVPLHLIERCFRKSHWEVVLSQPDSTARHLPKEVGHYFLEEAGATHPKSAVNDEDRYVPAGYQYLNWGDILPLPRSEKPSPLEVESKAPEDGSQDEADKMSLDETPLDENSHESFDGDSDEEVWATPSLTPAQTTNAHDDESTGGFGLNAFRTTDDETDAYLDIIMEEIIMEDIPELSRSPPTVLRPAPLLGSVHTVG